MLTNRGFFQFSKKRKKRMKNASDIEQVPTISGALSNQPDVNAEDYQPAVSSKTNRLACYAKALQSSIKQRSRLELFLIVAVSVLVVLIISLLVVFYALSLNTETVSAALKCDKDVSGLDLTEGSADYNFIKRTYEKEIYDNLKAKVIGLDRVEITEIRSGSLIIRFNIIINTIKNRQPANNIGEALDDMENFGISVDGENVPVVSHSIGQDDYNHSCETPIPGADILKHGIDPLFFNLNFNPSQGRKQAVFKMKCSQRKKWYAGKYYEVPYNLIDPTPTSHGNIDEEAKVIMTMSDVENEFSKNVYFDLSIGFNAENEQPQKNEGNQGETEKNQGETGEDQSSKFRKYERKLKKRAAPVAIGLTKAGLAMMAGKGGAMAGSKAGIAKGLAGLVGKGKALGGSKAGGYMSKINTAKNIYNLMGGGQGEKLSESVNFGLTGSLSNDFYAISRKIIQEEKILLTVDIEEFKLELEYKRPESVELQEEFEFFEFPESYIANPLPYIDFINKFGTHFVKKAKLGGKLRHIDEIQKNLLNEISLKNVKNEAKAGFDAEVMGFGGNGGFSNPTSDKVSEAHSKYQENKKTSTKYIGGSSNLAREAYYAWQPTVAQNPEMMEVQLTPLYTLIKDDNTKEQLRLAMVDYLSQRSVGIVQTDVKYGKSCDFDYNCDPGYDGFKQFHGETNLWSNPAVCIDGRCQCRMNMMWAFSEDRCVFECAAARFSDAFVKLPHCGMIQKQAGPQTWMTGVDVDTCAEKCINYDTFLCKSFTYRTITQDCQLHPYGYPMNKYNNILNNGTCVYDFESLFELYNEEQKKTEWFADNRDFYQRQCYEGADMTQYARDQTDAEIFLYPDRKDPSRQVVTLNDSFPWYAEDKHGVTNWKLIPGSHPMVCTFDHHLNMHSFHELSTPKPSIHNNQLHLPVAAKENWEKMSKQTFEEQVLGFPSEGNTGFSNPKSDKYHETHSQYENYARYEKNRWMNWRNFQCDKNDLK